MLEKLLFFFLDQELLTIYKKSFFLIIFGFLLRQSLVIIKQTWVNTFHHLATFTLLPLITFFITLIIKNDIALSLGMIGALSIIRFRNPVKNPFELIMFFALLTIGIVASVSLKLSLILSLLIIIILISLSYFKKIFPKIYSFSFNEANVIHSLELESSNKIELIEESKYLVFYNHDKEKNKFFYRLLFESKNELIEFQNLIKDFEEILNLKANMEV